MSRAVKLFRIIRPVNCTMMGLAVLVGETITHKTLYFYPSILGFVTAFTLTGASMITNDYWDRAVDRINAPNRPIASGLVSTKLALFYAFTLIAIGFSSAFLTNVICLFIAVVSLTISLLYNYRGKELGLIGNFMVSVCVSIPLFYGGFIYYDNGFMRERLTLLFFFDLIFFLANTGREVNKGMADIDGDRIRGVKTVAIQFGLKAAAIIAVIFYLSAVVLSVVPWFLMLNSWMYLLFVVVPDFGFVASSYILLRDYTKQSATKVKKLVLIWMLLVLLGLFAFFIEVFK